jgi:pimeloyl-ACP methyl ester carboxylesterase
MDPEHERIDYDEFSMFDQNAGEFGIAYEGPPKVRRVDVEVDPGRSISSLVWGESTPEVVFLHGGAQNAHTWDTVALALGRSMVAVDLPGHGHSGNGRNGSLSLADNARDVAEVIRRLAPDRRAVVGMSLGGLTTLALADAYPELVPAVVLVDITPGVTPNKSGAISAFVRGPASFPNFGELLARTIEHNPGRSEASLRRGILHNAVQEPDGTWRWRYVRDGEEGMHNRQGPPDHAGLWEAVSLLSVPVLLVRGMRPQSVVDDADEAELRRRQPAARVVHVAEAGHSVQGDTPVELAHIIEDFVFAA